MIDPVRLERDKKYAEKFGTEVPRDLVANTKTTVANKRKGDRHKPRLKYQRDRRFQVKLEKVSPLRALIYYLFGRTSRLTRPYYKITEVYPWQSARDKAWL